MQNQRYETLIDWMCLFMSYCKFCCNARVEPDLEKPLTCPEGFVEMKGSAFYEIMEGEEDA